MPETQDMPLSGADSVRAAIAEHEEAIANAADAGGSVDPDPESVEEAGQDDAAALADAEPQEVRDGDDGAADAGDGTDGADEAKELEQGKDGEEEEVILPPPSWNKDDRETFGKAPREIQEIVARRETERENGVRRLIGETAPLKAVADEYRDYFHKTGLTPDQSFRMLIAAEQSLRFGTPQEKASALQQIAREYGIGLPTGTPGGDTQDDLNGYQDPDLERMLAPVTERLGRIEGQLTSRQEADETARKTEADATAERFFDDLEAADPAKMPSARYVEQVMPRFQSMVRIERASGRNLSVDDLKTVYEDAAWATPEVRQAMQADMAARETARQKATTRKVKKVSSSASGGSGAPAHSKDPPENESARDTVRRMIAESESRGGAIR